MEKNKEICICPECFSVVKRKVDEVSLRNKNGDRIYFCSKECKKKYVDMQRKLKKLDLI